MKNKRVLFISAHYDDAVFSCGAFMSNLSSSNVKLDVVTVFSSAKSSGLSPLASRFHKGWEIEGNPMTTRFMENAEALNLLGASQINLGFLDCIYREKNGEFLVRRKEDLYNINFKDKSLLYAIEKAISSILMENTYSAIFLPLGIGNHLDHVLLSQLSFPLYNNDIYLYADMPYALLTKEELNLKGLTPVYWEIEDYFWNQYIELMRCYKSQYRKNWDSVGDSVVIKHKIISYFKNLSNSKFEFVIWRREIK